MRDGWCGRRCYGNADLGGDVGYEVDVADLFVRCGVNGFGCFLYCCCVVRSGWWML